MNLSRFIRCVSFSGLNLMGEVPSDNIASNNTDMLYLWQDRSGAMVSDGIAVQTSELNAYMQQSLARANTEGRLIGGFKYVMKAIEHESDALLFCILPENLWSDATQRALFKLLVAACHNQGVRMIKVDHDQLIRKIVEASTEPGSELPDLSFECLAIRAAKERPVCDRELLKFHQRHPRPSDFANLPMINLLES